MEVSESEGIDSPALHSHSRSPMLLFRRMAMIVSFQDFLGSVLSVFGWISGMGIW